MVNIQDLINKHFPSPESRQAIKCFSMYNSSDGSIAFLPDSRYIQACPRTKLEGELDLNDFINLETLRIPSGEYFGSISSVRLEKCVKLTNLELPHHLQPFTFLTAWKQEIQNLKTQLAEYESENSANMPGSWTETTSDSSEPLNTKIQRKKQELANVRDNTRQPTKHLRKEIELLEKIQTLENKITEHTQKEANYQQQIQQKEAQIQDKQTQLTQLAQAKTTVETNLNHTIKGLNQQITNLKRTNQQEKQRLQQELTNLGTNQEQTITNLRQEITQLTNTSQREKEELQKQVTQLQSDLKVKTEAEKRLTNEKSTLEKQLTQLEKEQKELGERMVKERQEALRQWNLEKITLQEQITQLTEQKDTFQKSADYLRSTLKDTEKSLEDTQQELKNSQETSQQNQTSYQNTLNQKYQALTKKQESYKLIQERNTDLQTKLNTANQEITKLTQWINKLEAASVEGDAFQTLQKELSQVQQEKQVLQEQLEAKYPPGKSKLWLYVIIALVVLYFMMS